MFWMHGKNTPISVPTSPENRIDKRETKKKAEKRKKKSWEDKKKENRNRHK